MLSAYRNFVLCVVFYQVLIAQSKCNQVTCSVEFSHKLNLLLDGSPYKIACSSVVASTAVSLLNCGSTHCPHSKVCISNCFQHQDMNTQYDRIQQCMVPDNKTLGQVTLKVLRSFGWRRALAIVNGSTSRELYEEFSNLAKSDIEICIKEANTSGVLHTDRHRIIVLVQVDRSTAIKAFCTAYHKRMFYPNYAWITVGINVDRLLNSNITTENCTVDNIRTVINYSLDIQPTEGPNCALRHVIIPSPYDQRGDNNTCSMANLATQNVTFIERPINSFNEEESVNTTLAVMIQTRLSNGSQPERSLVAGIEQTHAKDYLILYTNCVNHTTLFPDGIPFDGTPQCVLDSTHISTFIASVALFGALLMFAFWCVLFNILFRKRRIVKLTSPTLNFVMIFGTVLLGSGVVLYNIPIYSNQLLIPVCITRFGAIIFGHDLCFGIAMLKLFRVHYIFRNPSQRKKPIKDWHLLCGLGVILIVEGIVFVVFEALNFTVTAEYGEETNRENPVTINPMGITVHHFILVCGNSLAENVISGVTVTIKLTMQIVAIVLAIRIRNVKIDVINDAKEMQAIVYISTVLILSLVACNFILEGFANAYGVGIGACAYLESIAFLGLTFIPKMVIFCKDPEGKTLPFISTQAKASVTKFSLSSPTNKQPPISPITAVQTNGIFNHAAYTIQVSSTKEATRP